MSQADLLIEAVRALDSAGVGYLLSGSCGPRRAKSGGSERQLRDAAGVYEVQEGTLDESYLDRWARELGVESSLAAVRAATTGGGSALDG